MRFFKLRLWWSKWSIEHRLVTLGHVGRVVQEVANRGPSPHADHPYAIHWMACDSVMRELTKRPASGR
jgi:hypothetical protein